MTEWSQIEVIDLIDPANDPDALTISAASFGFSILGGKSTGFHYSFSLIIICEY